MSRPAALVRAEDASHIVNCVIRDISEGGARLALERETELPGQFVMLMSKSGNVWRRCELVWRANNDIGVRFLEGAPSPDGAPDP